MIAHEQGLDIIAEFELAEETTESAGAQEKDTDSQHTTVAAVLQCPQRIFCTYSIYRHIQRQPLSADEMGEFQIISNRPHLMLHSFPF